MLKRIAKVVIAASALLVGSMAMPSTVYAMATDPICAKALWAFADTLEPHGSVAWNEIVAENIEQCQYDGQSGSGGLDYLGMCKIYNCNPINFPEPNPGN